MSKTVSSSISPNTSLLGERQLNRVGNTPMLRLERIVGNLSGIQILAKAEWCNPGGSVKDRAASFIVADAERRGLLKPGKSLLDSTSGNTGIAYAMLGAAKGFEVTLCMPSNVSPAPSSHKINLTPPKLFSARINPARRPRSTRSNFVPTSKSDKKSGTPRP